MGRESVSEDKPGNNMKANEETNQEQGKKIKKKRN